MTDTQTETNATETSSADAFDAKRFILAGKAIFTLQGRSERYTYRVSRSDDGRAIFIGMLTGPDNLADYTYLGMLDERTGRVRLTRASKYTEQSTPVKAIRWALAWIWKAGTIPEPGKLYHAGRCGRCGRTLTVPASIESGFGPECAAML